MTQEFEYAQQYLLVSFGPVKKEKKTSLKIKEVL